MSRFSVSSTCSVKRKSSFEPFVLKGSNDAINSGLFLSFAVKTTFMLCSAMQYSDMLFIYFFFDFFFCKSMRSLSSGTIHEYVKSCFVIDFTL